MYNLNMARFFINDRARAKNEYYAEFPKRSADRLGNLSIKMLDGKHEGADIFRIETYSALVIFTRSAGKANH